MWWLLQVRRDAVVAYLATFLAAHSESYITCIDFRHLLASISSRFVQWLITVTGLKERITGATVGHGQEVGEGMTIPRGM
jgi:hypothetical protein